MEKKNEHNLITIKNLLDGKRFVIPKYQRGYSWGEKERKDLFEDVKNIPKMGDDYTHFTGTIIALKKKTDEKIYEIVDGQQRLTSIILLLHAIERSFVSGI
ncbi:MAG: DUF262 domain-containing protein [Candidatus Cloacimonetes bacterium]|nr:DUF262 domain-containing protein [Candidatus Cloacimonadota bacterium]